MKIQNYITMRPKNKIFLTILFVSVLISAQLSFSQNYVCTIANQTLNRIDSSVYFDLYIRTSAPSDTIHLASSSWYLRFNKSNFRAVTVQVLDGFTTNFVSWTGADCSGFYTPTVLQPIDSTIYIDMASTDPGSALHFAQWVATISNRTFTHRVCRILVGKVKNFDGYFFGLTWRPGSPTPSVGTYQTSSPWNTIALTGTSELIDPNLPLPVALAEFNSNIIKNDVKLYWKTTEEINNEGFIIERRLSSASDWTTAGSVTGQGTTNTVHQYIFEDKNLNTGRYKYRLKQTDFNGGMEYFDLNTDVIIGKPKTFSLAQNYPNPSNPVSKINFELPFDSKVSILVYDILGREVKKLVDENRIAGFYSVTFDGTNLASGVYFYRISASGSGASFVKTMKMVLIK